MSTRRPVHLFLIAQLICTILMASVTAVFWGKLGLISALLGGGVAAMNTVGTAFAWPRLLEKKDVALSVSIIVSKFALSLGIFYWLTLPSFATFWSGDKDVFSAIALGSAPGTLVAFALGLSSVVPAAIIVAVRDFISSDLSSKEDELT